MLFYIWRVRCLKNQNGFPQIYNIGRYLDNYLGMPIDGWVAACGLNVEQNLRFRFVVQSIGYAYITRCSVYAEVPFWIARIYRIAYSIPASCHF